MYVATYLAMYINNDMYPVYSLDIFDFPISVL